MFSKSERRFASPCKQSGRFAFALAIRRSGFSVCVLLAASLAGCENSSEPGVELFPVSGKVTVSGKPAVGARVVLFPKSNDPQSETEFPPPKGLVGEDGIFVLQTFAKEDGAPSGEYQVKIVWPEVLPEGAEAEDPRDILRGRYKNPERSGLTATVGNETTVLPDFSL